MDGPRPQHDEIGRAGSPEGPRHPETHYRALFQSLDDGFCIIQLVFDEAGRPVDFEYVETNAAYAMHTGRQVAAGERARTIDPDIEQHWLDAYGQVARTGETARFDHAARALNRHFDVYATRIGEPAQQRVAVLFKDVTERKRIEGEREELLARAEAARAQAEDAGNLRDEFLATISHELRTPLNSMLGWVQMLRSGRLPPEKHDHALETIERNARAQTGLIADLLDVSSILAGKLRLEIHPVDLRTVIDTELARIQPLAARREVAVHATVPLLSELSGDGPRLQQIIGNLLSNAVKFTPPGGAVHVMVEQEADHVVLDVTDTGRGIDAEFQQFAFDHFRQARGGTTRAHGGLGLGLSIVRQLVELHGGSVSVFSEGEGKGSTFSVRLPLSAHIDDKPKRAASEHPPRAAEQALRGLHVLLVEDEDDSREMVATLLEGYGARVRQADRAARGYELFQAETPDVLLSDIGMPEEDGYSLVARIRQLPGGALPAVALTAYAHDADRTRALASGFSNYLTKPVEPQALVSLLSSLRPH